MKLSRALMCLFALFTVVAGAAAPARAADAILYEVTEAVKVTTNGGAFKSSTATLNGDLAPGTALCPTWLAQQLNIATCSIIVRATGHADDTTGVGPANGDFDLVIQDWNTADAPEVVVLKGTLSGTIDLSAAFTKRQPLGSISGKFTAKGLPGSVMDTVRVNGTFTGTFRLPFRAGGRPSYLMDDGTVVPVQPQETSLGQAMVRLEVNFTPGK